MRRNMNCAVTVGSEIPGQRLPKLYEVITLGNDTHGEAKHADAFSNWYSVSMTGIFPVIWDAKNNITFMNISEKKIFFMNVGWYTTITNCFLNLQPVVLTAMEGLDAKLYTVLSNGKTILRRKQVGASGPTNYGILGWVSRKVEITYDLVNASYL